MLNPFVILLSLFTAAFASGNDWQKSKEAAQAFENKSAIILAEGRKNAASLRHDAALSEGKRITELALLKSVTESRHQQAILDERLAETEVKIQTAELAVAQDRKVIDENTKGCQAGDGTSCDKIIDAYARISQTRVHKAEAEIDRAKAHLDYESFQSSGIESLISQGAIDPRVGPEYKARLTARKIEYETSLAQLKLAKEAR